MQLRVADDSRVVPSSKLFALVGSVGSAIADAAPDGVLLVEHSGEIVLANRRAEGIFGYERGALLHCSVEQLLPTRLRARHEGHRAAYVVAPIARPMNAGVLLHGLRADGAEVPVEVSLSPFNEGSTQLTIAIVRDISEANSIRETAAELARAQERERIAGELVDSIIRRLFDIGLTLTAQMGERDDPGNVRHRVVDELDETIREVRRMVFDARRHDPPRPDYS